MDVFLTNAKDVIVLVLLFGGSIFIHELGHFLMALKRGLVVDAFSIGFGPALVKWKRNGVTYKISMLPLGGYVALPQLDPAGMDAIQGENTDDDGAAAEKKPAAPQPTRVLPDVTPLDKILVSLAGPAGNIVFATLLATAIWLSPNAITYKGAPVVRDVDASSKSYAAGLRPGDEILTVNGERVRSWYEFAVEAIVSGVAEPAKLLVYRGGEQLALDVPLVKQEDSDLVGLDGVERQPLPCVINQIVEGGEAARAGLQRGDLVTHVGGQQVMDADQFREVVNNNIGRTIEVRALRSKREVVVDLVPQYSVQHARGLVGVVLADVILPWMQEKQPLAQMRADAVGIFRLLKALVTPKTSGNAASGMGGPVMIIATLWLSIKVGLFNAFGFLRLLNVNLAIINLLPIPVLDGGHIVFAAWEGITRRKVHPKVVTVLVNVFAVVLIILFGLLTLRDSFSLKRNFGSKKKPAIEAPASPEVVPGDAPAAPGAAAVSDLCAERRPTRQVRVGSVPVGGDAPISVQTMTKTDTRDTAATLSQIRSVAVAGCDIVRLAVPDEAAAHALRTICSQSPLPIIADIHFDYRLALISLAAGVAGLRINPGNIGSEIRVHEVADAARAEGVPIRIGVNGGSLEKDLLATHGGPTPAALVESAMRHVALLEKAGFDQIKISAKASDVARTLETYRLLSRTTDYPLHLGVTEAGTLIAGTVRSAVAMGILLSEGIGDTIRISLTDEPEREVRAGLELLRALGLREPGAAVTSCPTCGRCQVGVQELASKVEAALEALYRAAPDAPRPHVAVMGCVVNGPGEAREADLALVGGRGEFLLYAQGELLRKVPEAAGLDALVEEVRRWQSHR